MLLQYLSAPKRSASWYTKLKRAIRGERLVGAEFELSYRLGLEPTLGETCLHTNPWVPSEEKPEAGG